MSQKVLIFAASLEKTGWKRAHLAGLERQPKQKKRRRENQNAGLERQTKQMKGAARTKMPDSSDRPKQMKDAA